jgi:hypothetical protein
MKSEQSVILKNPNYTQSWLDVDEDDNPASLRSMTSRYDSNLVRYIYNLQQATSKDRIDLREVGQLIDILGEYRGGQTKDYMAALLHPESAKGCKIPSRMPIPSSSFQLHSSYLATTNSSGNAAFAYNPFFLGTAGTGGTFFFNNNAGLNGQGSSAFFSSTNILQNIPSVYSRYRVVSASMTVKYIGRLDIVQGVLGGAIMYQTDVTNTVFGTIEPELSRFGDFNIAQDAYYYQEHMALNGLRMLYFPLDSSYENYVDVGSDKPGFLMYGYVYGGVPSSSSYKIDVYVNYECIPDPAFLNYIPVTMTKTPHNQDSEAKDLAVRIVQKKPITSEVESRNDKGESRSFWDDLISTVGGLIPGIATKAAELLIPGLKPLTSLTSSLLNNY